MSDTYRQVFGEILADHQENPRHYGKVDDFTIKEEGYNSSCGDRVIVYLKMNNEIIEEYSFECESCLICKASSSIMFSMLKELSKDQIFVLIKDFQEKLQGTILVEEPEEDIAALYGVKKFPTRIKCALLPWNTLKKGLDNAIS
jgi:nitrogen fixation NifU-like protein